VGADKGYDGTNFVSKCREIGFMLHVAQGKSSHERAHNSPRGLLDPVGSFHNTRYRCLRRTQMAAYLVDATYSLLRIRKIKTEPV
jgi:hypothetical protein